MWGRRFAYLAALMCSLVLFGFYKEWMSWILLLTVALFPWMSLLMSLPAMLTVRADLRCAEKATQDMPVRLSWHLRCRLPAPPVHCQIRLVNDLTGERYLGNPGDMIPTKHCGKVTISYSEMYVYDYLGLFRRRLKQGKNCELYIFPKAVPAAQVPQPRGKAVSLLRPKPGGGFSEIHDLRLYRPGDDLRQIHWKMSAKTGKLIYREPLEAVQKGYVLSVVLSGTPEALNTKLGQLLWLSRSLLDKQLPHEVRCLTGRGIMEFAISEEAELESCIRSILAAPTTRGEGMPEAEQAVWQHHIGGGGNDA